jgi:hypothetical protein
LAGGLLKVPAVLLMVAAVIVATGAIGWVVVSELVNRPHWTSDGSLEDIFGRTVTSAPWFVRVFLPFLTDSVSEPPPRQVARDIFVPMAPGRYWLGFWWSLLDWLGLVFAFGIAYGLWAGGQSLFEKAKTLNTA